MTSRSKYLVDFYYDVMSPFSLIGFEGILRYQKLWPISVQLKPFWLRQIFVETKNKSPVAIPNKQVYMVRELKLLNEFWGLNLNYPKDFKKWIGQPETSSEQAMRILITVQKERPEMLETVSRHYWKRIWSEGKPIFFVEDHTIVLKAAGLENPSYWIETSNADEIKQKLNDNGLRALSLGCFGAPWIVVHKDREEHCFFGSDRFHLIAHLIGEMFTDGKKELAVKL